MNLHTMRKHFFPSLLIAFFLICTKTCSKKIEVDIINGLPDPMTIRCQSKNDDLGVHIILPGTPGFSWKFKPNIFWRTLFFCHFWWGAKNTSIDVYNDSKMGPGDVCRNPETGARTCYWQARGDGLYFSNNNAKFPDGWTKKYDW